MNKKVFIVVMAGLLCSKGLMAEEQPMSVMGEEMVVTATKTLNSISNAGGSSVTVITADEIKQSGQHSVEEVIKGTLGIDVAQNGGYGKNTSVFLRGADSKNTLLLVDGVPFNDPAEGQRSANFANLSVANIERIEIVRGPVSSLYGSNATAGVINVITKSGNKKAESYAGIEGGAYATYKVYGGANGVQGPINYSFGISHLKTDGFSATDEKNKWVNPTGKLFENDGYEDTGVSGKIGIRLNEKITIESVLRYTDASVAYDNPGKDVVGNNQNTNQFSGRVALRMDYKPLVSTFYYNTNDQSRHYLANDITSNIYDGHLYELGWQGDFSASDNNTISVGLNYQQEHIRVENFGTSPSLLDRGITSNSVFLQDQWHIGMADFVGGLRYEDNEQFGGKTTYRFAPSYSFANSTLKFSYGTGFRAPSLMELYSKWGNAQLSPETNKGWDAGFEQRFSDSVKLGATYFHMNFDDMIQYDFATSKYGQTLGTTATKGVESFAEWSPSDKLFLTCNYSYTYTQDPKGAELVRRPKNKVGLTGNYKVSNKLTVSTNMQWVGSRRDTGAKDDAGIVTNKLPDYFLANVSSSYKLNKSVELYGRIDNLFDTWYEEAWQYATAGRSAYAGIKITY